MPELETDMSVDTEYVPDQTIIVGIPYDKLMTDEVFYGLKELMKRLGCTYISADDYDRNTEFPNVVRVAFSLEREPDDIRLLAILQAVMHFHEIPVMVVEKLSDGLEPVVEWRRTFCRCWPSLGHYEG
jgi:hypothetical protein